MRVQQLKSRNFYRRMKEESIALHGSVSDALDMAEEQIAFSLKTITRSQALVAQARKTLKNSNKIRARIVSSSRVVR